MKLKSCLAFGFALVVLVLGVHASAKEAEPRLRRFELGLSSGYSAGFLSLWAVPVTLDADYRLSQQWSVGAAGEVGFINASPGQAEDVDQSVKGHHFRVGVEALYHNASERRVQPWLGVGIGYDTLRATYRERSTLPPFGNAPPDPGSSSAVRASGFEVGHMQLGIDFVLGPAFAMGPFVGASVVAYRDRRGIPIVGVQPPGDFSVWSNIGLKATLRL
jgi:hypothetical protein